VSEQFNPSADRLVSQNNEFAESFNDADMAPAPSLRLAIVACMDVRLDILEIFGLRNGEAHILRNAGGVITDDVVRSLCLSQRLLGTQEIILLHHTDCGLQKVNEDEFKADLATEHGMAPSWPLEVFDNAYADTTQSMQRLVDDVFVETNFLRGFVYDVTDGRIREVGQAQTSE
tara:strand:- start:1315 stop:1836 length:522 start_codon:yes stop_codon:yes gene_type:complete